MERDQPLRIGKVIELTTLSRSEIYRRVAAGTFPKQHRASHKTAVWRKSEVTTWLEGFMGG
jgi:prophage regulatory protein